MPNPALREFVTRLGDELVVAQVLVSRRGQAFDLRHVEDRAALAGELREVKPDALRTLAQFAANGAFRPLKSAPDLPSGWRAFATNAGELGIALEERDLQAIRDRAVIMKRAIGLV